ncbi:hypothetical protein GGI07_005217 [Coemansia sp. Benny D115]|nr:hypothetical protein GGI07_005217 [Coemansia sp. Benny D115]
MPNTRSKSKKAPRKGAKAAQPSVPPHVSASTSDGYGEPRTANETEMFREFTNTWESITEEFKSKPKEFGTFSCHRFSNCEKTPLPDSKIKPDGVLFLASTIDNMVADIHILFEAKISEYSSTPPPDVLGQIAEYSHEVWSAQPTRTFVPVFLLHGGMLSLFVFPRSDVLRINLGRVFYKRSSPRNLQTSDVAECLMRLMFFTQQTPKKFGHFVDRQAFPSYLKFSGSKSEAEAEVLESHKSGAVTIMERIERTVPLLRRAAYLYRAIWKDKKAVLKLSWTPHDRQPEGAIYDILKRDKVSGIPEIYGSGILIKNFFDYRLEYILMEDCGATVNTWNEDRYWCNLHRKLGMAEPARFVGRVVDKVSVCLSQAKTAGVLHRDISAGNIAVNGNGDVYVIDWGFAKPISNELSDSVKKEVGEEWGFKINDVSSTESHFDPMTGTLCFMGIRILSGHSDRSIFDDSESLLYVALHYLMKLQNLPNEQAAMAKVGGLSCRLRYPMFFDVDPAKAESVCETLRPLYNALFIRNDGFNGARLAAENDDFRLSNGDTCWPTIISLCNVGGFSGLRTVTDMLGNNTVPLDAFHQTLTSDTPTLTGPQRALQMQNLAQAFKLGASTDISLADDSQPQNMASGALEQRAMSDALLKDYLGEIVWDYATATDKVAARFEIADACKTVITTVPELPQKYLESIMKYAKKWPDDFNKAIIIRTAIDFFNTHVAGNKTPSPAPKSNNSDIGLGNLNIASQSQLSVASSKRTRDPDDDNDGEGIVADQDTNTVARQGLLGQGIRPDTGIAAVTMAMLKSQGYSDRRMSPLV